MTPEQQEEQEERSQRLDKAVRILEELAAEIPLDSALQGAVASLQSVQRRLTPAEPVFLVEGVNVLGNTRPHPYVGVTHRGYR